MEKYGLLFESIFKRKLTDENTAGYLENLAKEYPYFSIAQFYLLQLSPKNTPGYKAQAAKAAVLFNNNHWLNFQLLESGNENSGTVHAEPDVATVQQPDNFADKVFAPEIKEKPVAATVPDEQPPLTIEEETVVVMEKVPVEEINLLEEEKPEVIQEAHVADIINIETAEEKEKDIVQYEEIQFTPPVEEINIIQDKAEEENAVVKEEAQVAVEEPVIEEEKSVALHEGTIATENVIAEEKGEVAENVAVVEETKAPEATIQAATASEPLLFEPLHTTDYFASVGIKLSEEEKTSDKLGKQLKSFTEWLRTMKKVHTEQVVKTSGAGEAEANNTESSIQKLAEKSNQENDVVTEAMAEVLMQQGRFDKAREIMEKLSLLNPGKSAYFAAKINQIKEK